MSAKVAIPGAELDWPHREHSRFLLRGGIRWHVQTMGHGPPMLLLHGTGASSHSFRELMPLLASTFTVVVPDLPGHAFTQAPAGYRPGLPEIAAALADLLDEIRVQPVVAVGHSAGAALIARMALDRMIEPARFVALAPALVPFQGVARAVYPSTARLLSIASRLVPLQVGHTISVERVLRSTGSSLDARGIELYRRLSARPSHVAAVLSMMANWDLEPLFSELPQLRVPLLVLAGGVDRAVPVSQLRALRPRIPSARVVVLEGLGHLFHEEQPVVVARHILDETASLVSGSSVGVDGNV